MDILDRRDPAFIRMVLPWLGFLFDHYHQATIEGFEHLPPGRALVVGNHNGGIMAPDMFAFMVAFWRRFGVEAPSYGLAHDFVFRVPIAGAILSRLGAVPARPAYAEALLNRNAPVLVYPGGDLDAFKPHARRHEIVFGERLGFVRLALRTGAPLVPVVSIGAHEGFFIVADGAEFARRSGLKRLTRMEVLPLVVGLPWGVFLGTGPYLPLPVRMRLEILPAITWPNLGPDDANDETVVRRCREEVRQAMQDTLDRLARDHDTGVRLPR